MRQLRYVRHVTSNRHGSQQWCIEYVLLINVIHSHTINLLKVISTSYHNEALVEWSVRHTASLSLLAASLNPACDDFVNSNFSAHFFLRFS